MKAPILTFLSLLASSALVLAAPAKPLRALLVAGGCCHDYANQTRIISEGLSKRLPVEWTIIHDVEMVNGKDAAANRDHVSSAYSKEDWAKGYDVIVHDDCYGAVTDPQLLERITSAHRAGVPAMFLHCAMHSYRASEMADKWRELIGVRSTSHEKQAILTVKSLEAKHPVMVGFPETWTTPEPDELYRVEKLWDTATPLGMASREEPRVEHPVILVNKVGNVRTFSTTLGHGNQVVGAPEYLDLIGRGLLWVCGKLEADGKASAGYEAPAK